MKTISKVIIFSVLAIILACCNAIAAKPASLPTQKTIVLAKIINHERPNIQSNFLPFTNVGCKSSAYDFRYDCEEGSQLLGLGCNSIIDMPLLGGLSPNYPIAACDLEINEWSYTADIPVDGCVYTDGVQITSCYRYVIYKDDKYQLIKTLDEFRALYAPIDSPEEALSFTLASDNFIAKYGQTKNNDYIYSVQVLEDTYVETTADGYIAHVFETNTNCEPFETRADTIKVTHDGHLIKLNSFIVYSDTSQSGCT